MKSRLGRGVVGISSPIVGIVHSFLSRFLIARLPCTEQKRGTFRKKAEDFGRKPRVLRRTLRVFIRLFRSVFALLAESIDAPRESARFGWRKS